MQHLTFDVVFSATYVMMKSKYRGLKYQWFTNHIQFNFHSRANGFDFFKCKYYWLDQDNGSFSIRLEIQSTPFTITTVDLFGQFLLKNGRNKSMRAWGAIFAGTMTRGIHLNIVENASHYGWPDIIILDVRKLHKSNGAFFAGNCW